MLRDKGSSTSGEGWEDSGGDVVWEAGKKGGDPSGWIFKLFLVF